MARKESKNINLQAAKKAANDEFYTQMKDIEEELLHYRNHFVDKVVFCNCDDPKLSNFWRYFHRNFTDLKLKKLISTHYNKISEVSYKMEYMGGDDLNILDGNIVVLKENGDFRSDECIQLLCDSDIVVTNPPFSLFREYIQLLIKNKKKFLVLGNQNAITYKEIFPLIKNNELWLGINNGSHEFLVPDNYDKGTIRLGKNGHKYVKMGNIAWYTNLDVQKRHTLFLTKKVPIQNITEMRIIILNMIIIMRLMLTKSQRFRKTTLNVWEFQLHFLVNIILMSLRLSVQQSQKERDFLMCYL